jgi:hypothetical protein
MSVNSSTSLAPYGERNLAAEQAAMAWYGWGSPVGMAVMVVALGVAAVLFRLAIFGQILGH